MTREWYPPRLLPYVVEVTVTPQQSKILVGICSGHENEEIAQRLGVTLNTLKQHIKNLYPKLGAHNRAHAVALVCSGQVRVRVATQGRGAA